MSNLWDYNGADCMIIKDYDGLKKYLEKSAWSNLIHLSHYPNVKENKLDWTYYIGHSDDNRFINHFDPEDCEVEDFLRNLAKYSEDFDILIFDHYARYEMTDSWFRLKNTNGVLTISKLRLSSDNKEEEK